MVLDHLDHISLGLFDIVMQVQILQVSDSIPKVDQSLWSIISQYLILSHITVGISPWSEFLE